MREYIFCKEKDGYGHTLVGYMERDAMGNPTSMKMYYIGKIAEILKAPGFEPPS